jgi:hypothetical protein
MSTPTWQLLAQIDRIHEMAEHPSADPAQLNEIELVNEVEFEPGT